MSRYIDADALNKILGIGEDCTNCQYSVLAFCRKGSDFVDACEAIADAPTADVRENRRGKFVKHVLKNAHVPWGYDCTTCGAWFVISEDTVGRYRFCPNCGAKMDILDRIKVNVNCKVTISEDTVERCLMLIEMYLNDNPGKVIRQNKTVTDDGLVVALTLEDEEIFR